MKKQHIRLKLCRTAIALLNDPMSQEIRGGNDLMFLNSKLGYNCSGIKDTATVTVFTTPSICDRCADAATAPTDGKA